jgi:predicted RNase H-like HicB family nuclease
MVQTYDALFELAEEGGFVITFPDLSFGVTQAMTKKKEWKMAVDCIETVLGELIKKGQPLPVAKKRRGKNYRQSNCRLFQKLSPNSTVSFSRLASVRRNWLGASGFPRQT